MKIRIILRTKRHFLRKHRSQPENKLGSSPTTSRTSLLAWTRRAREWSTAMTLLGTPRGEDQSTCWLKKEIVSTSGSGVGTEQEAVLSPFCSHFLTTRFSN